LRLLNQNASAQPKPRAAQSRAIVNLALNTRTARGHCTTALPRPCVDEPSPWCNDRLRRDWPCAYCGCSQGPFANNPGRKFNLLIAIKTGPWSSTVKVAMRRITNTKVFLRIPIQIGRTRLNCIRTEKSVRKKAKIT
jgi:hypothetical protein